MRGKESRINRELASMFQANSTGKKVSRSTRRKVERIRKKRSVQEIVAEANTRMRHAG